MSFRIKIDRLLLQQDKNGRKKATFCCCRAERFRWRWSGNISVLFQTDFSSSFLKVVVTDSGSVPPLSSSTRVVVTVEDVNDNSPEFLERFYKIQIPNTHLIDHHNHQSFQVSSSFSVKRLIVHLGSKSYF